MGDFYYNKLQKQTNDFYAVGHFQCPSVLLFIDLRNNLLLDNLLLGRLNRNIRLLNNWLI